MVAGGTAGELVLDGIVRAPVCNISADFPLATSAHREHKYMNTINLAVLFMHFSLKVHLSRVHSQQVACTLA